MTEPPSPPASSKKAGYGCAHVQARPATHASVMSLLVELDTLTVGASGTASGAPLRFNKQSPLKLGVWPLIRTWQPVRRRSCRLLRQPARNDVLRTNKDCQAIRNRLATDKHRLSSRQRPTCLHLKAVVQPCVEARPEPCAFEARAQRHLARTEAKHFVNVLCVVSVIKSRDQGPLLPSSV